MIKINSGFIGDFKLGDNINHNLKILERLYYLRGTAEENAIINKPIIIFIASIIEAIMHDFHFKAKRYTREGVKNIAFHILNYIRGQNIDKFYEYIKSARKHKIFDSVGTGIYDDMDTIRKLRNRIHIQNSKKYFEDDEVVAFSDDRKKIAETTLEKIMKFMSQQHARNLEYVEDFILPWGNED